MKDILLDILKYKEENSHDLIAQLYPLLIFLYHFMFFKLFYCCSITVVCIFPLPLHPNPSQTHSFLSCVFTVSKLDLASTNS